MSHAKSAAFIIKNDLNFSENYINFKSSSPRASEDGDEALASSTLVVLK